MKHPATSRRMGEQQQRTPSWFQASGPLRLRSGIRNRLAQLCGAADEPALPDYLLCVPSPDGRWIARATPDPSTDLLTWHIWAAGETGEPREQIRDAYPTGIAWLPSGLNGAAGFYYDRYLPYPGGHGLYFHQAGTPQRQDPCALYQPEHPGWYYQPAVSPNGRWLAVTTLNGSACNLLTLYPLDENGRPSAGPVPVTRGFLGRYDVVRWQESRLILRAVTPGVRNGRLIAVDLPAGKREILLAEGDLPLQDAVPLGDGWVVGYLNEGRAELHFLDGHGQFQAGIPLPGLGTVDWLEVDDLSNRLDFAYSDYARPTQIYTWQPGNTQPMPAGDPPSLAFEPADFVTRPATIPSADGTLIPLFLAHRRDLLLRDVPALLTAYGGLGYAFTPRFSADVLAWMEMGGLYVSVCARGGGELGERWHRAGVGAHKQHTFDDVLAAARWLVTQGMTTPRQLGLWGASNGGLTAGACLTQQPDLFGAVVIESGLLDMLDYHRLGRGREWLVEYGDPDDPAQRMVLAAYSPLHNIQPGRVYPPTLIASSDHDPRVGEAHSLRFAQRLADAQAGTAPVLLRVDSGGGHGDHLSQEEWLDRAADRMAFFAVQLGLEKA